MLWFLIIFMLVLLGGFTAEDSGYWLTRVRVKLPFLGIPIAMVGLKPFTEKQINRFIGFLIIPLLMTSIWTTWIYYSDTQSVIYNIGQGHSFPVPFSHIRFSLLIALTFIGSIWSLSTSFSLRYWIAAGGVLLFAFLHLLAVRSGLVCAYAGVALYSFLYFYKKRQWTIILCMGLAGILIPAISVTTIPTLKQKVGYMRWDWQQLREGTITEGSDATRWYSILVGIEIFKEHPLIGVGTGSLKAEVERKYQEMYPEIKQVKMPHNQFVSILAANGLLGLILFLLAILMPIIVGQRYRIPITIAWYAALLLSFMVENTLETAAGVGIFILFTSMGLCTNFYDLTRKYPALKWRSSAVQNP